MPEAPAASPSPALSVASAATVTGACRGAAGGVIGYFHAGSTSPGHQGQTITLARGARVRADYPDRHSNFNANAPIRCVLPPGSTVRLDAEPITVPGQAVWVPLVAGSVL